MKRNPAGAQVAPSADNEQQRQHAVEPQRRGPCIAHMRIAGIHGRGTWRYVCTGQFMQQRQHFPGDCSNDFLPGARHTRK